MENKLCSVHLCGRTILAKDLCSMHYQRMFRHGTTEKPIRRLSVYDRFWAKINKTATCWLWVGAADEKGYGTFYFTGKIVKSHRVSWELHHGAIPEGKCILHTCDTPACINPDHLFVGTKRDNAIDMVAKGRHADLRGSRGPGCKLTEAQVLHIRRMLSDGESQVRIAKLFAISNRQISNIHRNKSWKITL